MMQLLCEEGEMQVLNKHFETEDTHHRQSLKYPEVQVLHLPHLRASAAGRLGVEDGRSRARSTPGPCVAERSRGWGLPRKGAGLLRGRSARRLVSRD